MESRPDMLEPVNQHQAMYGLKKNPLADYEEVFVSTFVDMYNLYSR